MLKGELLVVVGRQRRGFDLLQQLPEALLRGKACADRQRVDEEADQGFEIGMVTTPDRNTNRKILLAAVAMQQQGNQGEQAHLERGALKAAELLKRSQELRGDLEGHARSPVGWGGGPGMVAGELERFETCELGNPVVLEGLQAITAEALALPGGVVVILHLQRRQLGSLARAAGVVESGEIASQHRA